LSFFGAANVFGSTTNMRSEAIPDFARSITAAA
jgi:hypothetical protein